MYELAVESQFSAAHRLRGYSGQCERLHGHNYRVEVRLHAQSLDRLGMVADFTGLKRALSKILSEKDHAYHNEVAPFDQINPTAENLARTIAEKFAGVLSAGTSLARVTVWESARASASYVPEGGG